MGGTAEAGPPMPDHALATAGLQLAYAAAITLFTPTRSVGKPVPWRRLPLGKGLWEPVA